MPGLKAISLFVSVVLVNFGLLPVTMGYLDVSGGQSAEDLSSSSSMENEFPHSLRHHEHYNHRIEHAVKESKKKILKTPILSASTKNNSLSAHQIYLRHHHRGNVATSTPPPSKSGHHLRHHNRHHESWENRVLQSQGQQHQGEASLGPTTTVRPLKQQLNLTNTLRSRLFDRDSLYTIPRTRTTTGPKSRHNYGSHILPASGRASDRAYGDDNRFDDRDRDRDEPQMVEYSQKYSDKNNAAMHLFSGEDYNEDNDNGDDEDDDYQYEGGDEDEQNEEPALDSEKWNKIDIQDRRNRREHSPSAKPWVSISDDTESLYSRYNIPGTLTQHKFEELGTHDAVKQSRKTHITNHMQNKALANAHASRIYSEANCRLPQQRVERIQKDPSKMYVPHCTILHRCGDDTGCCKTDRQTCAPKRTQSVDLYFFVKSFNSKQGSIERHTFVNHTECHCVDKSKHYMHSFTDAAPIMRKATVLDCNCPKLFEKILQEDGVCRCDCSSGNIGCNYLKRGMEHFSMIDRKCIIEGRCKPPTCEFGSYLKKHGRCQKGGEVVQQPPLSWSYN
ncbi:uncharacterized protein LOC129913438 [Episyrphus balteatus]|uniref:uncharacterized protein LOC129913438 n=1 Tax=Episyrphus balteatus TaxID=286459 RepID=UPI0024860479|nr:uncharacterized protein LOC129913438 [Episyrphus balteatus]